MRHASSVNCKPGGLPAPGPFPPDRPHPHDRPRPNPHPCRPRAVDDPEFWEGVTPLEFGTLPRLQDQVAVVGYPVGGESISITVGVVSRIEVRAAPPRLSLRLRLDCPPVCPSGCLLGCHTGYLPGCLPGGLCLGRG